MKTYVKLCFLNLIPNYRRGKVDTCGYFQKYVGYFNTVLVLCLILVLSSCATQTGQVSQEKAARNALDLERRVNADALKAETAAKLAEAAAARAESAARMAFPEAVHLHIKADPQLNYYQAGPHTLFLCIYHLKDSAMFNQLMDEKDGPAKLLECGRFDPSVLKSSNMIIQPSQEVTESLGRVEGARYVGIIAGYYNNFRKERIFRSFRIPGIDSTSVQKMGTLYVDLYLGPQEMVELRGK
jgi:type VI secretion system VasD/TssJ family lipoprotein